MWQRIRQMLIKEFIQVLRDPRIRTLTLVTPCVQVLLIGYAVTTDVKHVPTAVCDLDNTLESRELTARFVGSGYFDVLERTDRAGACSPWSIAATWASCSASTTASAKTSWPAAPRSVQMILDGTDSNTAAIVTGYANSIVGSYSQQILTERFDRRLGAVVRPGQVELRSRAWFNENLESRNYYVPGVIAIVVTLTTLILTSMAVVREKEIGTIEQIMVTPIRRFEFVLGKTVPFAIIAYVEVCLITVVGVFWFQVPVRGSLLLLFAATGLYLLTTLGMGLLISTVSQTQQQAMMSTFFFFFPAMMLSGFVFPIANMPQVVQWLTLLNPLRYFLVIIRGVFLKGIGPEILWPQMAALAVMGVTMLWFVSLRFHKTM